jgi:hypothetical protein
MVMLTNYMKNKDEYIHPLAKNQEFSPGNTASRMSELRVIL